MPPQRGPRHLHSNVYEGEEKAERLRRMRQATAASPADQAVQEYRKARRARTVREVDRPRSETPKSRAPSPQASRPASARKVRASLVASAREVAELHEGMLEKDAIGRHSMKAPPRLERVALRHGGGYRTANLADYDWFYSLSRAEQSRLRENWMTHDRDAMGPDEIDEKMPLRTWLDHTRRADAARALATGKELARNRYGGLNPNSLIAGEPYDAEAIHDRRRARAHIHEAHRAGRLGEHHRANAQGVEFFTDHEGIVHPIRATYQRGEPADYRTEPERESSARAREFAGREEF